MVTEDDIPNNAPKTLAETLYKQGAELVAKNKILSTLKKLYEISALTLEPQELVEKISKAIQADLQFELVSIFFLDQSQKELNLATFFTSDRLNKIRERLPVSLEGATFDASSIPSLWDVISDRKILITENLADIYGSLISADILSDILSEGHIKSSIAYPLVSRNKIIGILTFSVNRTYDELFNYEKESVEGFVNVTTAALDRALLYKSLKIVNQKLEIANERQQGLIHFISHEVKGYLTKSQAVFSVMLDGDYGAISSEAKDLIGKGLTDVKEGVGTVMNILNAANIKEGTVKLNMQPCDMKTLVLDSIAKHQEEARDKGITFNTRMDQNKNYMVLGDCEQLSEHVIRNLIDNAIKYTEAGWIEVGLSKQDGKILFSVKDTGIGLTEDDKSRLFTEGGRGKDSLKTNVHSTGYGLVIARRIINDHKGKIWAESEGRGKGSKFFVELNAG